MGILINNEPILNIYINGEPLIAIMVNQEMVWPNEKQNCFCNGYWIDEYPWTDDSPWID